MARIDFHSKVADKTQYCCRLIRKIMLSPTPEESMRSVVVVGSRDFLDQLDEALWVFSATEFLPHAWADDEYAEETPVIFVESFEAQELDHLPHSDVLIHVGREMPKSIDAIANRFPRMIEIVSTQESDLLAARERYKLYRAQGHELINHDQTGQ